MENDTINLFWLPLEKKQKEKMRQTLDDRAGLQKIFKILKDNVRPDEIKAFIKECKEFDIDNPVMRPEERNEARRLVTFIDACYEHKAKVICSAGGPPDLLYVKGVGEFEFKRCASRLIEMQAEDYMATPHVHLAGADIA